MTLGVSFTSTGMRVCALHQRGDHLDIVRHLADGRAHAALAHAVRAAEIQLDPVGVGILDAASGSLFQALSSQGTISDDHQRAIRPVALHLLDLAAG